MTEAQQPSNVICILKFGAPVCSICYNQSQDMILVGSIDFSIQSYCIITSQIKMLTKFESPVLSILCPSQLNFMIFITYDGILYIWNENIKKEIQLDFKLKPNI
ncbi:hypothetical protein MXB_4279 [Myxobolus squamalis]|nr:hypothetical protein MXB_4279 [Myxobolus squamalis]